MLGTSDIAKIADVVKEITGNSSTYICEISENPIFHYPENAMRQQITVGASDYIKLPTAATINADTVLYLN